MRHWVVGALAVVLSGVSSADQIRAARSEIAVPERIIIETYLQNSYPKYIANEDGTFSGWAVDVMRAIEQADPSLVFQFPMALVPFVRIHAALENGDIDVFLGTIRNEQREQLFHFVEPGLFPTRNVLAVRADYDATGITSLDDVIALGDDGIILVDRGTAHETLLRQIPGAVLDTGVVGRDLNLAKLLAGRADFYYSTDVGIASTATDMGVRSQIQMLPFAV